ncbi:MAG: DNA repair exonuclease [Methanobacteriaceae archaeon]|nr:DNA repair exonuclease [Methanobacteriaceae archaeon]
MVRFLHTADWHLGMKYSQLHENAEKARQIRIKTIQKLLDQAGQVDFILMAGDLFDSNDVDKRLLNTVSEILGQSTVPTYIIPGNHDPLTLDSLYRDPVWDNLDNVIVFKESEPFTIPHLSVTIYPSPVSQKQSKNDPTQWINSHNVESEDNPRNDRNDIKIGLAHGNLAIEGFIDNPNFPINPNRTEISDLDYLALGEWHSLYTHQDSSGINRTVYPGTPETTKFSEQNSGKAVIVDIQHPRSPPIIQEMDVGNLTWEKHKEQINSMIDAQNLHFKIQQIKNPQKRVISINLTGVTDQDTINYLDAFQSEFQNRFMHFDIRKDGLFLKPNLLELQALLPEGAVVNRTFEALIALMKTQPEIQEYSELDPERTRQIFNELRGSEVLEGLSPEIINRAILLMYQLIREAAP